MAGIWENLTASFILAWRGYDPDNFNPRRKETRISLVLRADGKAYLKYLWALQYGVEYWDMTQAIVEGTLNESANPILIATEDMGRNGKIKLHDDEYEFAAWVWTNQRACDGKWEKGRDYLAVRENAAVALFFGEQQVFKDETVKGSESFGGHLAALPGRPSRTSIRSGSVGTRNGLGRFQRGWTSGKPAIFRSSVRTAKPWRV